MKTKSTVLTVSELTRDIKNQLEGNFSTLSVQGEISNFKPHSSGHLYFDLKDGGAKIPAVMFRNAAQKLVRRPKEGDHVTLRGGLSVYEPHGRYQLLVRDLAFVGVGELLLQLEALKKKLHAKGYFSPDHKKPLPKFPKTIGVITSPTGAVIQDIINVLTRRLSGFHLKLNPVRVQGTEAAGEIAQAIRQFNAHKLADVLIVGRGGGSLEDLWPFNEESVADAIFESEIPIISAVGHETDMTIADFVADVRAPTPSAAAEIVTAETALHVDHLTKARQHITRSLSHLLERTRLRLDAYRRQPLFLSPYAILSGPMQRLDELRTHFDRHIENSLLTQRQRLTHLTGHLASLDPKNVLNRGYSILFSQKEDSVIVSTSQLKPKMKVKALLADGKQGMIVDEI